MGCLLFYNSAFCQVTPNEPISAGCLLLESGGRIPAENSRNVALRRRVSLLQEFSEGDQET